MSKIKNFIIKFKKWIIGFLVGGTVLASGLGAIETEAEFRETTISQIPISVQMEKTRNFAFEDENVGENIIIKTEQKDYKGFGGTRVYFQATNASKTDQNINLAFSLADNPKWEIKSIQRFDGNQNFSVIKTRRETIPTPQGYATTTGNPIPAEIEIDVEYQATETRPVWTDLSLSLFEAPIYARKDVKGTQAKNQATDYILSGETKYYRADVRYPQGTKNEEFFIEAFGEDYGHLDPANWNYVVDFESGEGYSIADLNSQNNWTGDTDYDVQSSVVQSGSQAISIATQVDDIITQDTGVSDITAGTVVWEMRKNVEILGVDGFDLRFYRQDASLAVRCRFKKSTDDIDCYGGADTQLRATSAANTWFTFTIQFDATANTSSAWIEADAPTTLGMAGTGGQDIESIKIVTDDGGASTDTFYLDNISDGAPPASAGVNKSYIILEE